MRWKAIIARTNLADATSRTSRIRRRTTSTDGLAKTGDFAIPILYGRVLRNFFISSITCASFER